MLFDNNISNKCEHEYKNDAVHFFILWNYKFAYFFGFLNISPFTHDAIKLNEW